MYSNPAAQQHKPDLKRRSCLIVLLACTCVTMVPWRKHDVRELPEYRVIQNNELFVFKEEEEMKHYLIICVFFEDRYHYDCNI